MNHFIFVILYGIQIASTYRINHIINDNPIATTSCGPLQGTWETIVNVSKARSSIIAAFRGIPFGAPPIGKLRWKPPNAAPCWHGTFDATKHGKACYQLHNFFDIPPDQQSEDCLNLDVFTDSLPSHRNSSKALSPVFVLLHGGGAIMGSSFSNGPVENLVGLLGDSVLVVINYRLHAFGFLTSSELSKADPRGVSGNYGILDQQLALKWIQLNIAHFGGDPGKVTVYGQSSGGTSILALLSSPSSKDLFHGAICMSSSPNITMDLTSTQLRHRKVLDNTNCTIYPDYKDILKCLYSLNPLDIIRSIEEDWDVLGFGAFPTNTNGENFTGVIIVDGSTVTMPINQALRQGLIDVPVIFQTLAQEWDFVPNSTVDDLTQAQFLNLLNTNFLPWDKLYDRPAGFTGSLIADMYASQTGPSGNARLAFETIGTDLDMGCGNTYLAIEAGHGFKSPVYLTVVAQPPSGPYYVMENSPSVYAFHKWDLLVASEVWAFRKKHPFSPKEADISLGQSLRKQWQELTLTGNLNSLGWATVIGKDGTYNLMLQTLVGTQSKAHVEVDYRRKQCETFRKSLGIDKRFWLVNR